MKVIKEIKKRYVIIKVGDNMRLISLYRYFSEKEKVLLDVKTNLEDKLLQAASTLEKIQIERLDRVQKFSSKILAEIQMLKKEILFKDMLDYIDKLILLRKKTNDLKNEWKKETNELEEYKIKKILSQSIATECNFFNREIDIHKKNGEINRAMELNELLRSIARNASYIIGEVMNEYEGAMKCILRQVYSELEEKWKYCLEFVTEGRKIAHKVLEEKVKFEEMLLSEQSNIIYPKTHNELKKYLESNGFEIERYNGSHQIYKNSESGEIRVLPSRRGAHVLAPKTRKKIIEGVVEG